MKAELQKERTSIQKTREEYTTRLADLQCREDQMKANSTANIFIIKLYYLGDT